jgi:peptidoglycan/LPS O-acetylase OafA/YrhL
MKAASKARLPYIPALDGLRACAVTLVVFSHTRVLGFQNGDFGVEMFFVLSGFLITSLLLQELDATKRIDILRFYARRLLRLYPALLLFLLLYAIAAHAFHVDFMRDVLIAGSYLTDYAVTYGFASPGSLVNHTWSLSIEEQYYLLWPWVLLYLCRICTVKGLPFALLALFVVGLAREMAPLLTGAPWTAVYFRLDARLGGLMLGAALAAFRRCGAEISFRAQGLAISGMLLLICMFVPVDYKGGLFETPVAQVFTFFLLARVMDGKTFVLRDWLAAPGPVFIGRISYGIYLFHYPVAVMARSLPWWPLDFLAAFPVAAGLAWFSWSTVERAARLKSGALLLKEA